MQNLFSDQAPLRGGTTSVIGSGKNQLRGTVACVSADRKGGPGTGKPDPPKYTTCWGRPQPTNPRYSGFPGLFGVYCLRLHRLGSSVGFGTGTRMAPRKNLRTRPGPGVSACKHGTRGSSNKFCPPIQSEPLRTSSLSPRAKRVGRELERGEAQPNAPPLPGPLLLPASGGEEAMLCDTAGLEADATGQSQGRAWGRVCH